MIIRIVKDLPRLKIGDEVLVEEDGYGEKWVKRGDYSYYLDEIEGYYQKVIEMPKDGEKFWSIDCYGRTHEGTYENGSMDSYTLNFQGWRKTKESAEAFRDKILEIKEREND